MPAGQWRSSGSPPRCDGEKADARLTPVEGDRVSSAHDGQTSQLRGSQGCETREGAPSDTGGECATIWIGTAGKVSSINFFGMTGKVENRPPWVRGRRRVSASY